MNWSLSICLSLPFHGSLPCCFVGCQNTAHHAEPLFYSLLHFERQRKIACIEWKCPKHHTRLETWISHRQFPISSFSFSDPWVAWSRFFLWGLRCSALHEHVVGQRNNTWWFTTGTGKLVQIRLICPFIFISISIQYKKKTVFSIQHKKNCKNICIDFPLGFPGGKFRHFLNCPLHFLDGNYQWKIVAHLIDLHTCILPFWSSISSGQRRTGVVGNF